MYQKPPNFSTHMTARLLTSWHRDDAIIACSLDTTKIQFIYFQPCHIYIGGRIMGKARDTQKTVKKKAEKTLKEKRKEKKEKKKQS
ncbi:MAG: hypothetical protein K9K40_14480 [Desulfotignum sp.]|nr:hypothetical protein [Desulfotignum sp.]